MPRTAQSHFLGLDIGTSGVKATLVDKVGDVAATATVAHPLSTPQPGWAEQRPEDWWRAAQEAIASALREMGNTGNGAVELVALGVTGQMHGLTLLDAENRALRPAMLWCDNRTEAQCDEINETVGLARLREIAANPAQTGFMAPKLLWVREHEPALYTRARHALLPKDYLRLMLSGEYATDVADASGTLLLDVRRRAWSVELLERLRIDPAWLPAVYEGPEVCARVSAKLPAAIRARPARPRAIPAHKTMRSEYRGRRCT